MSNIVCEPIIEYKAVPKYWNKIISNPEQIELTGTSLELQIRKESEISIEVFGLAAKNDFKFKFDWEGGLKELKKDFDGVTLQHHINTLRK